MMTAKVTERGVLIPKALLGESKEVEIERTNGFVIVRPLATDGLPDPILEMGVSPAVADVDDASIRHDFYVTAL